ncbi:MAG: nucleotide exchange factor GrpE [Nanoarchaeota archaeon]
MSEKTTETKSELNEKSKLAEDRLNQLKYLQADFDNYRKKFEKEKEEVIKFADEKLIKELIIVLEDFERSLKEIKDEKTKEGFKLVYSNLSKILEKHGLKPIEALGKKFDYNLHEVLSKEFSEKEEGIITEEFQKGFMLKSKVIRPSKVKITSKDRVGEN